MQKTGLSLRDVVGPQTYTTWVEMPRQLVPEGRTNRLAPLIAAMLQYATVVALEQAEETSEAEPEEKTVARRLAQVADAFDLEDAEPLVGDLLDRLFGDAGVSYRRTNARGERYSVANAALYEYIHWYDMPWEA